MLGRSSFSPYPVEVRKATAFVGQDFHVPAGPIQDQVTITYDWWAYGHAIVVFGVVAIASVDLAISNCRGELQGDPRAGDYLVNGAHCRRGRLQPLFTHAYNDHCPFNRDDLRKA